MKMTNKDIEIIEVIEGRGGGGKGGGSKSPPKEAESDLVSNTIATAVDLISEGEIEGLVNGERSIYFNQIPLRNESNELNYSGVEVQVTEGYPSATQDYLKGITDSTPTEKVITGNQEITKDGTKPTPQLVDAGADSVRLNLYVGTFLRIDQSSGEVRPVKAELRIDIQPNGGSWVNGIKDVVFQGIRSGGQYVKSVVIRNLTQYGPGPWNIRVERITDDYDSAFRTCNTFWSSYTEIIDRKLNYPNCALMGFRASAKDFGTTIPSRFYHMKLLKCSVPTGYDPVNATYSDPWDGSMKAEKEYTNNPAWILYELCTNKRFGLGIQLSVPAKIELYNMSKYNDFPLDDGQGDYVRRYTFNYVFNTQTKAIEMIKDVAASCNTMVYYDGYSIRFSQDAPKTPSKLVTNSNVINGLFNYTSSSIFNRHNVAKVTWFDMNNFCKPKVEVVEDKNGILRYGERKTIDIVEIGCTSRSQAHRKGKWFLYTELYQTDLVSYQSSWDHADVTPGDIIKIMDYDYAGVKAQEGRIVDSSTTGVTIDSPIVMKSGHSYTIDLVKSDGSNILERGILTNIGSQTQLVFNTPISSADVPKKGSVYIITDVNELEPRQFRVLSNNEIDKNIYEINAVEHNPNKYVYVEQDIPLPDDYYSTIPDGVLEPPTNLIAQEFSYTEGYHPNLRFGILLTWNHSPDTRKLYYEIQWQDHQLPGSWKTLANFVNEDSYIIKPVEPGIYDFRVRAIGEGTHRSWWETLLNFELVGDPDIINQVTGLKVVGGPDDYTFLGKDCEIEWNPPAKAGGINANLIISHYVVKVLTIGDVLLRVDTVPKEVTNYIYTLEMNTQDNINPIREFKFQVYAVDENGKEGTPATLSVYNPPPTMAGFTPTVTAVFKGVIVEWSNLTLDDPDGDKFSVYIAQNTPPSTKVTDVEWRMRKHLETGLDDESIYYAQIEPYDVFGPGPKSNVSDSFEPLKISLVDIDEELTTSIVMTDSKNSTSEQLEVLYDRIVDSGGISYQNGDWINYNFGIELFQEGVRIYPSTNAHIYVSYRRQDGEWKYLGGNAQKKLDDTGAMTAYSTQNEAINNYLQLTTGKNVPKFPNGIIAVECRLHILSSTTIRELIFIREVIAEQIVADRLSAISSDIGSIYAGTIFLSDYLTLESSLGKIYMDGESIVIGEQTPGHNYAIWFDGDIEFYQWNPALNSHQLYKNLRKFEHGVSQNNTTVTVPGPWNKTPQIIVSPNTIKTYLKDYSTQDQTLEMGYEGIGILSTTRAYRFIPRLRTTLGAATNTTTWNDTQNTTSEGWVYGQIRLTPPNTSKIKVNISMKGRATRTCWSADSTQITYNGCKLDLYINVMHNLTHIKLMETSSGNEISWSGSQTVTIQPGEWYYRLELHFTHPRLQGCGIWGVFSENIYAYLTHTSSTYDQIAVSNIIAEGDVNWWALGE